MYLAPREDIICPKKPMPPQQLLIRPKIDRYFKRQSHRQIPEYNRYLAVIGPMQGACVYALTKTYCSLFS